MAIQIKHAKAVAKADGLDATVVQPSDWNASHTLTAAAGKVLGTAPGSTTVSELPLEIDTSGNLNISGTIAISSNKGSAGQVLVSGGSSTPPSWGSIGVAAGGTGATTLTGIVKGNGTSSFTAAVAGTDYVAPAGNVATATNLSTNQSNWSTNGVISAVVGMLAWKNYGNGHVIFDASQGLSPSGSAVGNVNAASPWIATYPTLMGWNGSSTYGVRVDSARVADSATVAGTASSVTYLGSISTSSGNIVTLSGINLTGCKFVYAICENVDPTTNTQTAHTFSLGGAAIRTAITAGDNYVIFDLALTRALVFGGAGMTLTTSTLTTAATSISATTTSGNFTGGTIYLYSVR